jgi:hypothetical protein
MERVLRVIIMRINTLLCELAMNEDAKRDNIHGLKTILDAMSSIQQKGLQEAHDSTCQDDLLRLLRSKRNVMADLIKVIDAVDASFDGKGK